MDELAAWNTHPKVAAAFRDFIRSLPPEVGLTTNPDWPSNTYTVQLDGDKILISVDTPHSPDVPFGADPHEVSHGDADVDTRKGLPGNID